MQDILTVGVAGGSGSGKTTLTESLIERFGDADLVFLDLPAVVVRAVIAQAQRNVFHRPKRLSTITPARKSALTARAI